MKFIFVFSGKFRKMGTLAWKIWIVLPLGEVLKDWGDSSRTGCIYSCNGSLPGSIKRGRCIFLSFLRLQKTTKSEIFMG